MELAARTAEIGNQNSLSDAGVAILQAKAGLEGAAMNVLINIPGIEDQKVVKEFEKSVADLRNAANKLASEALDKINTKLLAADA